MPKLSSSEAAYLLGVSTDTLLGKMRYAYLSNIITQQHLSISQLNG